METKVQSKELLCKTAQIAGFEIVYWMDATPMVVQSKQSADGLNKQPFSWNPLTNDGDAFRLLVLLSKLGVDPAALILQSACLSSSADPERSQRLRICIAAEQMYEKNIVGLKSYG